MSLQDYAEHPKGQPVSLKCPNCSVHIAVVGRSWFGREFKCPNCAATLTLLRGKLFLLLLLSFFPWFLGLGILCILLDTSPLAAILFEGNLIPSIYLWSTTSLYLIAAYKFKLGFRVAHLAPKCGNCGSSLRFENAHFCPNCGASLSGGGRIQAAAIGHKGTVTMPEKGEGDALVGACMICKKELRVRDLATWCPFCGGPAHRAHLLEYLQKHGQCPLCGAQLDRKELKRQLSQIPSASRTWKPGDG